jgi:hypothetical protein
MAKELNRQATNERSGLTQSARNQKQKQKNDQSLAVKKQFHATKISY